MASSVCAGIHHVFVCLCLEAWGASSVTDHGGHCAGLVVQSWMRTFSWAQAACASLYCASTVPNGLLRRSSTLAAAATVAAVDLRAPAPLLAAAPAARFAGAAPVLKLLLTCCASSSASSSSCRAALTSSLLSACAAAAAVSALPLPAAGLACLCLCSRQGSRLLKQVHCLEIKSPGFLNTIHGMPCCSTSHTAVHQAP